MKAVGKIILLACALSALSSCVKEKEEDSPAIREAYTRQYVNQFAVNIMNVYYLWVEEIKDKLQKWMSDDDPKTKVLEVRYKDENGKDIDRWSQMTDDYATFVQDIEGVSTTYGYELRVYYATPDSAYVGAAVKFVYADSPAEKAGLKRGDFIVEADGKPIPTADYVNIITNKLMYSSHCTVGLRDGRTVSMDAVQMYCNPIHITKVFDCGGKKVGYIHFTSFTLNACKDLVPVCKSFKEQGVSELVLDLRYNTGGYVQTEEVFASMLAPEPIVASGTVFMTEVYNQLLNSSWGEGEMVSHFTNRFSIGGVTIDTAESNIGLTKIYAIMTGSSASASEAIICGLKPFIDVTIVGQQSYGKYCTGMVFEGAKFFEDFKEYMTAREVKEGKKYAANWGIYVMIGRYADKNGETGSMPNGFTPDVPVADNPMDGYQLGDPQETMLKAALTLAGYKYPAAPAAVSSAPEAKKKPAAFGGPASIERETFGVFLRQKPI